MQTAVPETARHQALESLWSAWKLVRESNIGYHADFATAVKRLDEMDITPAPDISWDPAAGLYGCATCKQRWGRNATSRCLCGGA